MDEKPVLNVVEAEVDETSLLTPAELSMLMKGEEEEGSANIESQEAPKQEAPKEDVKAEVKEEPKKEAKDTKSVLEELLGLKRPEPVKTETDSPLTDEQKRIQELESELSVRKEMELIQKTLEGLSEDEVNLIAPEVANLIQSDLYEQLRSQSVEKRVASLITYARGLQADALKEAMLKKKESESQTRKEYEGLSSVKGNSNEVDLKTQQIKELQRLAMSGDRDASAELLGLTDPALEELIKQSL